MMRVTRLPRVRLSSRKADYCCVSAQFVVPFRGDNNDDNCRGNYMNRSSRRKYHSTQQQPVLPLVLGIAVVTGGYILFKFVRGESVIPNEAAEAQKIYRQQEGKFSNRTTSSHLVKSKLIVNEKTIDNTTTSTDCKIKQK